MAIAPIVVTFTSNNAGLNAGAAQAQATLQALQGQMQQLAQQMIITGQGANSALGQQLRVLQTQASQLTATLRTMGAQVSQAGANAANAGHGFGAISRELIVLGHEASQGRFTRLGGSLIVLAEYAGPMAAGFALANPAIAAAGVAALAAAGAFAYLAIQSYETGKAVRGLEFDAARNQIALTGQASADLLASVQKLGNVGAADAREFIEPFLALGPVGEAISAVASRYLPLFIANGKTAKQAGDELAKAFENIGRSSGEEIRNSRVLSESEKAAALQLLASGDKVGLYNVQLTILSRSMAAASGEQARAAEASRLIAAEMAVAAEAGGIFTGKEEELAKVIVAATDKTKEQEEELARWILKAQMAADAAGHLAAAMTDALKVDKISAGILEAEGKVKEFQQALTETKDPATIAQLNRSLEITQDRLAKLREQFSSGITGGNKDALGAAEYANQLAAAQKYGSDAVLYAKQLATLQSAAAKASAGEQEGFALQIAEKSRQLKEAEYADFKAAEDLKVAAAGKNSAAVIAIREAEAAHARAIFGAGSDQERAAIEAVARAKEQAANRGAAAATKAAKDELGATEEGIKGQIAALERHTASVIDHLGVELKLRQITSQQEAAAVAAAYANEKTQADALYAHLESLAGISETKKAEFADQEMALDDKVATHAFDAQAKAAEKTEASWEAATKTINSAFDSQIGGLLRGTENWHTAFKNVLVDLSEQMIKFGLNKALTGIEGAGASALGIGPAAASGGVGLFTQGFGAAPSFGAAASGAAGNAALITSNTTLMASINALTVTMGGIVPATAASDVVTTANTGAVAAGTAATLPNTAATLANTVSNFFKAAIPPGFASGTPYVQQTGLAMIHQGEAIVPASMNPFPHMDVGGYVHSSGLAMIHAGETVQPAQVSTPYRGGASTTHNHTWNVQASNPMDFARQIGKIWNSNPSLRPLY